MVDVWRLEYFYLKAFIYLKVFNLIRSDLSVLHDFDIQKAVGNTGTFRKSDTNSANDKIINYG